MGKTGINKMGISCNDKQLFPFLMEYHKENVRIIFFHLEIDTKQITLSRKDL